jgi:chitinase
MQDLSASEPRPFQTFCRARPMHSQSIFRRLCLLAATALAVLIAVDATEIMHRPDNYKDAPNRSTIERNPKTSVIQRRGLGTKVSFAYFTNWGIYGANFRKLCFYILDAPWQY